MFKVLNPKERLILLSKLKDTIILIAQDKIGYHSLQILISHLSNLEEKRLMSTIIQDTFTKFIDDNRGVHIIERLIICLDESLIPRIYKYIIDNFLELSNSSIKSCLVIIIL